jgi:poly(glycerol-phosphate) alpha-glucosyltransferase
MRIAHVSWLLSRRGGGVAPAVLELARAQRELSRDDIHVLGVRDRAELHVTGARVFDAIGPVALGFAPALAAELLRLRPDLVHLQGLFTWPSQAAQIARRVLRAPLAVSPHGMLAPWALARSAWKKLLFRAVIENDNLRCAAFLHALSPREAASFREIRLRAPIVIVPSGVHLPDIDGRSARTLFAADHPEVAGRRIILFLARVHPVKGLPHLVDAWARILAETRAARDEWLLVVAGPDYAGHAEAMKRRAAALGIAAHVLFTGGLFGDAKLRALAAADVFVLPSFTEGFSIAVLEALAARTPVFLTRQCGFDVAAFGAGLVGEPTADSVYAGLRTMMGLSDLERREWGENGRREMEARYRWPVIARQMARAYEWALGGGAPPPDLEIVR